MIGKKELEEAIYTIINCYGKESIYYSNGELRQKDDGDYHTDEKGNRHYMSAVIETLEKAIDDLEQTEKAIDRNELLEKALDKSLDMYFRKGNYIFPSKEALKEYLLKESEKQ